MLPSRPTRFLAALALSVLLAAMPSLRIAGQTLAAASVAGTPPITPLMPLPDSVSTGAATNLGAFAPTQMLRLAIALRPPHLAEEEQFLHDLQDRSSPLFHKYLTPDEWNARFAPSAQDEQAVVDWATAQGLSVTQRYANRLDVDVAAPVSTINRAFGIQISTFRQGATTFWSADRQPTIPSTLQPTIGAVMGLSSLEVQHSNVKSGPVSNLGSSDPYSPGPVLGAPQSAQGNADPAAVARMRGTLKARAAQQAAGSTPASINAFYDPTDLYSSFAYDWDALISAGHCCNPLSDPAGDSPVEASIAIVTGDAISFDDIAGFHNQYPYLAYKVTTINVDGMPTCCGVESTMDTEWATAMANSFGCACSTAHVWVYQAPTSGGGLPISRSFDMMNAIVNDHHADAYSTSWGCSEQLCYGDSTMNSWHAVFNNMLGIGMSLTAAAGDNGTTDTCDAAGMVDYPASDPDMTSAGGTTALFRGGFQSEQTWTGYGCSGGGFNQGGTGGGCSSYWSEPFYQAASAPNLCGGMRMVPDVALNAAFGQNIYVNGSILVSGGTSIVAPELAGFFAEENAYLLANNGQGPFGQANVGFYSSRFHFTPHNPYYDVTSGCQGGTGGVTGNCAGAGFDLASGWGSFNALQMVWQFNWNFYPGVDLPVITFTGPAIDEWYNTDQLMSWNVTDPTGAGIAGFTARDGFDPGDPATHATPQHTSDPYDSFYQGPESKGATGVVSLSALGQGQHTENVRAWNNMGQSSLATYGWVGYDTVKPHLDSVTLSAAAPTNATVITSTATADDPGCGSTGSCVAAIRYSVNAATDATDSSGWYVQGSPPGTSSSLAWSTAGLADGRHLVVAEPEDVAGNVLTYVDDHTTARVLTLDRTAPATTASLAGTTSGAGTYTTPVTVTLRAADNVSGVARTVYQIDGGPLTTYTVPFVVSGARSHSVTYHSIDRAGNTESTRTVTFTIDSHRATTTTVTGTANLTVFGQTVTFTASVAPQGGSGTATGTVTFKDGANTLGTGTLSGGHAAFGTSSLAVGAHSIIAVYGGDSTFSGSTSSALSHTVNRASTTTTLMGSANPTVFGQAVTFTARVTAVAPGSGIPSGTMIFKDGATMLGTKALNGSGIATFTTGTLAVGVHSLTAVYSGSGSFITSTSAALSHTVNRAGTLTTVRSSANPAPAGSVLTFTARVAALTPGSGIPSGTVTLKDGSTVLNTMALDGSGIATLTVLRLAPGVHSITAVYSGSPSYNAGTSAPLSQTVVLTTSTTLAGPANPPAFGQMVTITATVQPALSVIVGFAGSGTVRIIIPGTVTFKDGTTVLGTRALNASDVATFSTAALAVGVQHLTAVYNGSAGFAPSVSTPLIQTVNRAGTTTALTSSLNPSTPGRSVTFTATARAVAPGAGVPTGLITFKDGATTLATVPLGATGTASLATSGPGVGTHSITATYVGDGHFTASSGSIAEQITAH